MRYRHPLKCPRSCSRRYYCHTGCMFFAHRCPLCRWHPCKLYILHLDHQPTHSPYQRTQRGRYNREGRKKPLPKWCCESGKCAEPLQNTTFLPHIQCNPPPVDHTSLPYMCNPGSSYFPPMSLSLQGSSPSSFLQCRRSSQDRWYTHHRSLRPILPYRYSHSVRHFQNSKASAPDISPYFHRCRTCCRDRECTDLLGVPRTHRHRYNSPHSRSTEGSLSRLDSPSCLCHPGSIHPPCTTGNFHRLVHGIWDHIHSPYNWYCLLET
jgi:hypothetical protein